MAATMQDVAKRAHVSTATVSRVINHPEVVNPETRQCVLEAIHALNYQVNVTARTLRTQQSYILGIIAVGGADTAPLVESIKAAALRRGYVVQLGQGQTADGLLYLDSPPPKDSPLPALGVDVPGAAVGIDYAYAAFHAVRYLYQLRHRHIALLIDPGQNSWAAGFEKACRALRLTTTRILSTDTHWQTQLDALTALITTHDLLAAQAYETKKKHLAVMGCGDLSLSRYLSPPLTTFKLPTLELGEAAVTRLLRLINGQAHMDKPLRLKPTLIIRESTTHATSAQTARF